MITWFHALSPATRVVTPKSNLFEIANSFDPSNYGLPGAFPVPSSLPSTRTIKSEGSRHARISQNRAAPQFAILPKHEECLQLPANGGNFAKKTKKVEKCRRAVAQVRNALITKEILRDDQAATSRPAAVGQDGIVRADCPSAPRGLIRCHLALAGGLAERRPLGSTLVWESYRAVRVLGAVR